MDDDLLTEVEAAEAAPELHRWRLWREAQQRLEAESPLYREAERLGLLGLMTELMLAATIDAVKGSVTP